MLDLIIKILLIILLSIQLVTMISLLFINIRRYREDKKFWKQMDDALKTTIDKYNFLALGDGDEKE